MTNAIERAKTALINYDECLEYATDAPCEIIIDPDGVRALLAEIDRAERENKKSAKYMVALSKALIEEGQKLIKANKVVDEQHELIKLIFSDLKMRADEDGTLNLSDFIVMRIIEVLSNYRSDEK